MALIECPECSAQINDKSQNCTKCGASVVVNRGYGYAAALSVAKHNTNRAIEHLLGLVTGLVADGELNDLEIKMLSTWLASHPEATAVNSNLKRIQILNSQQLKTDTPG